MQEFLLACRQRERVGVMQAVGELAFGESSVPPMDSNHGVCRRELRSCRQAGA